MNDEKNKEYRSEYYTLEKLDEKIDLKLRTNRICVHKYLSNCTTNPQPPGFADFLRGTITLYNLSQQYNYNLYLDNSHIIFKYLKPNVNIINEEFLCDTVELLPPLSYDNIYHNLHKIFMEEKSFSILTNSFYQDSITGQLRNFGNITNDCRKYLKDLIQPNEEIINKVNYLFENIYNINKDEYFETIHLRCGDSILHNNIFDLTKFNMYCNKIKNLIRNRNDIKYILFSDSSEMAKKIKQYIPELGYWENSKVHLGDLKNCTTDAVIDTLVDFFIMSRCKQINVLHDSGFSKVISIIGNITYNII